MLGQTRDLDHFELLLEIDGAVGLKMAELERSRFVFLSFFCFRRSIVAHFMWLLSLFFSFLLEDISV